MKGMEIQTTGYAILTHGSRVADVNTTDDTVAPMKAKSRPVMRAARNDVETVFPRTLREEM